METRVRGAGEVPGSVQTWHREAGHPLYNVLLGRTWGAFLGGREDWEMREWVQVGMLGKAALTLDHVLCPDQSPASDMDGNNMANMASCNGAGHRGR